MGCGVRLCSVVLGGLFGLVVFPCIVFCILCIIIVLMFPLSRSIKCEEHVYVLWCFALVL